MKTVQMTLIQLTDEDGDNLIVNNIDDANMITCCKDDVKSLDKFGDAVAKLGFTNGLSETSNGKGYRAFKPSTISVEVA